MTKVRQDAWSHEDDLLLAETVLRHIREGSTQLNAFEEVGDQLNRTSAACGFRWNAEVRNKYHDAIELAKRQRKEKKRAAASQERQPVLSAADSAESDRNLPQPVPVTTEMETAQETLTLKSVIQYLQQFNEDYHASSQAQKSLEQMEQENEQLRYQVRDLESQLTQTSQKLKAVQEDYQVFMQIMDKARKMTVFDKQQDSSEAPAFRMDKNGNLEQVADSSSHQ
ncbi:RsfA family transcriptional regulator [Barrientosiimonas marina]|uniref:RsfA family transcriptional regulator n=1 Tax=Lentibacillus kimchii TaxID=1542911 RepID=A0ABW2UVX9_9BACI